MRKEEFSQDYRSDWEAYAYEEEEPRFLSSSEEDLSRICDVVRLDGSSNPKTSGGIPVHYDRKHKKLYTLKEGHARVSGESGSKKSRTVSRGQIISCVLNRDSIICTDPKGELYSDPKIASLLKTAGYDMVVMDFRYFDKDGFNVLSYPYEKYQAGDTTKAMNSLNRFVEMLKKSKEGSDDPYWNNNGGVLVRSPAQFLLTYLSAMQRGEEEFHLASVKTFIRQEREGMVQKVAEQILERTDSTHSAYNALFSYKELLALPEKTYSCVASSAISLISDFCSSDDLLRMLSISTFDIRDFYRRPCVLFMIVPDETKAYDMLVGYLFDTFYEILIEEYGDLYQGKQPPSCRIHMICDEIASIYINDMSSKISASRSREIEWSLIYQSDRQMEQAYRKDYGTILGNCRNTVFLGSSDYEILKSLSEQVGKTAYSDELQIPLVSVADLRRMKKEWEYKDALIISGPYLYCARLTDYEQYPFLKKNPEPIRKVQRIPCRNLKIYTPEDLYEDFENRRFPLTGKAEKEWAKRHGKAAPFSLASKSRSPLYMSRNGQAFVIPRRSGQEVGQNVSQKANQNSNQNASQNANQNTKRSANQNVNGLPDRRVVPGSYLSKILNEEG